MNMKKLKLPISALSIGLLMSSAIFAAGFGEPGEVAPVPAVPTGANQAQINQLLNNNPLEQDRQQAVPPSLATPANGNADAADNNADANAASDNGADQQAFAQSVRNMLPMTPEQIKTLHYMFDQSQRAASGYPGTPPRPTSSTVLVNLSPGATPPVIRLKAGFVTSLVFLDSTGQPWPIVAYDLGDPQAFNLQPNQPDGKSNTLLVQALDTYKSGNLAVMLKDQDTPIMLTLMPGQRAIDYRVDLRIPGLGPNAQAVTQGLPETATPQLVNFLDGVPPPDAKELQVDGGNCQVWLWNNHLFLRTTLSVLSPGWISSMSSPDGTHVFELTKTPVVLASQRGAVVQLMIRGL